MADDPANLVLELLREIRAEVAEMRHEMTGVRGELAELKREVVELRSRVSILEETQTLILGHLVEAKLRDERLARDLVLLSNRITVLEVQTGIHNS